jgi:hypothetical protein
MAIRSETADSTGEGSIALDSADVVRGVVGTAGSFIDSSFRVWAKGASHIDAATLVDSSRGDGFRGLVLFTPAFERRDGVELIRAGAAAAMGHAGDHEEAKPVVLIRAHVFQDGLVIRNGIKGGDRARNSDDMVENLATAASDLALCDSMAVVVQPNRKSGDW